MSCEKKLNRVSRTAGVQAGVSQTGGRAGNAVGMMTARLGREATTKAARLGQAAGAVVAKTTRARDTAVEAVGQRAAPISNKVLGAVNRPATIAANLVPAVAAAAAVSQVRVYTAGPGQGARPGVAVAVGMRDVQTVARNLNTMRAIRGKYLKASLGVGLAASAVAAATSKPDGEEKTLEQVKKRGRPVQVHFSQTRLTGLLNRRDRLVGGRNVVSSEGNLVRVGGSRLWHRGTSVVKTGQGEQTVTHLRRLALPPTSHYFDRKLSDAETAEIVSGQAKAHKLPGYVGSIDGLEQLAPTWAQAKRAMILTRLHWPTPPSAPEERWTVKPPAESRA